MANKINGYTTIGYPESLPSDWVDRLDKLKIGYCYSLHDKDVDGDGVIKKAHLHIYFQSKLTKKQKEYIFDITGVKGEDVRSAKGIFDYLTHKNNPDKHQYQVDNIVYSVYWSQEMFDLFCTGSSVDNSKVLIDLIDKNNITEYFQLINFLVVNGEDELLKISKNWWVKQYIDSKRYCFIGEHDKMRN